jgi:hypothetical protein|tara:strand:+ start:626 stop:1978 length:1353 start_codon:yes stop_codon:yes gene_type:complete
MTHISEIIENILVEWAYRVHDGMPNPKNTQHIHELRESMEELNLPNKVIYEVINNIINKDIITEKKGSTSDTTFYHEIITGIIVGGGKGPFKTGEDVSKHFKNGTIVAAKGKGATPIKNLNDKAYIDPQGVSFFDKSKIIKSSVVSDAVNVGNSIVKNLGKASKPVLWTGPTNDKSIYGAGDIGGKFSKYGNVGVSLKKGKGQLKNLTVNTFFKALGLPKVNSAYFLKTYKKHWDAMCEDWVTLVEKDLKSKTKDKEAISIFNKHSKKTWDEFQKESLPKDELEVLNKALGTTINKTKFKDFCRKLYDYGKEWNEKRDKHFNNIFKEFSDEYDKDIRLGLHNLFKRQLSVGETSLFYAAKGGKTFWFIPSEELYNKTLKIEDFITDYDTEGSGSGYDFYLDVGTQEVGAVGTIKVTFRWKNGQMVGFPDTTSDYQLVKKDWSDLLGAFKK